VERRLAAILAADVAGYTALMGADEAGTLQRLTRLRQEFLEPLINEHRGRIVKLMGDGLLVEFASVVDAVACALAWQRGVAERDEDLRFRIGVNLGDVIVEEEDIHGDGVNIAARLEGLAEPGGVCLSGDAYRQAKGKVEAEFEDLGQQDLKNIADPVQVYRIVGDRAGVCSAWSAGTPPIPNEASVAVLPFENKSGDPDQDYFADGLTENIITGLTRFREMLVIGVKSILVVRKQTSNLRDISRVLGVAHIVEGSVRKAGNRVRVTAQLVDAATGQRLWAENYDRDLDDIFAVQDEITNIIVATLAGQIEQLELRRAATRPVENLAAYDHLLRGRQCLNRYTKEGELEARQHFEQAIELDPNYAAAHAGLSISYLHEYEANWSEAPEEALQRASTLAQKAVALDDADSSARYAISLVCYYRGQHELSKVHMEKALELNPNDYHNICNLGWLLAFRDQPSESIACSVEAMRLNPLVPDNCLFAIGIAEYVAGRYEEALAAFGKTRGWGLLRPAWIAACYAQLGRDTQAHAAAAEVRAIAPSDPSVPSEDDIERWHTYWSRLLRFESEKDWFQFLDGLRKAGLPA
jgi:TolB-like protein/Flp pilus assembly protein TadD